VTFRRLALTTLMCLVVGGLGGLLAAEIESEPAAAARFVPPREPARDFRLQDQDGRWTTLAGARGDVVVLTFLYVTCWDLCPAQAAEIADAVEDVGEGVRVYIVSVDPVGDRPERIHPWLEGRGLDGGDARYLIGSRKELSPVWAAYGIVPIGATDEEAAAAADSADRLRAQWAAEPETVPERPEGFVPPERPAPETAREPYPDTGDQRYRGHPRHRAGYEFEHSAYVMLVDKRGVQRLGIPFEELDPASLAHDLRLLRDER